MLLFLHARDLARHPGIAAGMFADRAAQFRDRLGWPVTVGADGGERDGYDALDPLYVVWASARRHAGSLRLLPTTGRTMLAEHFALLPGSGLADPRVWECTRFCTAASAGPEAAAAVLLGACAAGLARGMTHAVAVFDPAMERVYARLGWQPEVLGRAGTGRAALGLGRWRFGPEVLLRLAPRAGVLPARAMAWAEAAAPCRLAA